MDSQRLPNVVKWDGWPGSTTRDDTSAPTTYQTKQDQSYVQMNSQHFRAFVLIRAMTSHTLFIFFSFWVCLPQLHELYFNKFLKIVKICWTHGTMQRSRQLWVSKVACCLSMPLAVAVMENLTIVCTHTLTHCIVYTNTLPHTMPYCTIMHTALLTKWQAWFLCVHIVLDIYMCSINTSMYTTKYVHNVQISTL